MFEKDIVDIVLENLEKNTGIKGTWKELGAETEHKGLVVDGKLELILNGHPTEFYVEVKREIRRHHIQQLIRLNQGRHPFLLVAERIYPKLKEDLRREKIPWLDGAGNIYIETADHFIWIDRNEALPEKRNTNRAFTKTGLKVVFLFLHDEDWLNRTHREIADAAGVALGNIPKVFDGLRDQRFIIPVDKKKIKLIRKRELLDQWITAYGKELKPNTHAGNFVFFNRDDERTWRKMKFQENDFWGGEPAADLLTDMLKPQVYTIYTDKTRAELMNQFRLKPDPDGNVEVYKPFWDFKENGNHLAPALVVYADLIITQDERNTNIAQNIYEKFLQDRF